MVICGWGSCLTAGVPCPGLPLLGTWYVLGELALRGFAGEHLGLGSRPGIQALVAQALGDH